LKEYDGIVSETVTKCPSHAVRIPEDSMSMRLLRNIRLDNYNFFNSGQTRKIFSVGYEHLTAFVYYQESSKNFILVISKNDDQPLILEKKITRAEAFRLMNTRP